MLLFVSTLISTLPFTCVMYDYMLVLCILQQKMKERSNGFCLLRISGFYSVRFLVLCCFAFLLFCFYFRAMIVYCVCVCCVKKQNPYVRLLRVHVQRKYKKLEINFLNAILFGYELNKKEKFIENTAYIYKSSISLSLSGSCS